MTKNTAEQWPCPECGMMSGHLYNCPHFGSPDYKVMPTYTHSMPFDDISKKLTDINRKLDLILERRWMPGEPCDHPGCLSHVTHPCEGCGRIGGEYEQE